MLPSRETIFKRCEWYFHTLPIAITFIFRNMFFNFFRRDGGQMGLVRRR